MCANPYSPPHVIEGSASSTPVYPGPEILKRHGGFAWQLPLAGLLAGILAHIFQKHMGGMVFALWGIQTLGIIGGLTFSLIATLRFRSCPGYWKKACYGWINLGLYYLIFIEDILI